MFNSLFPGTCGIASALVSAGNGGVGDNLYRSVISEL